MRIEIISGSARHGSQTKRVARHLYNELKTNADVGLIDLSLYYMPPVQNIINSAKEATLEVKEIVERVFEADAFILVSPEYNGSYSPAMKNFMDHFPKQNEKVFGIVTASPGSFGGIRAALQLQTLIYGLMGIGSPQMLIVPEVNSKFEEEGTLVDEKFKPSVDAFIEHFLWLSRAISFSRATSVIKRSA